MADADNGFAVIFDRLPFHQVKKFVFSRLDLESIKNCRLVCKRWEKKMSEAVYFNPELINEETAQVIKNFTKPVKDLTLSFLNFPYPTDGYGFKSVQKLIIKFPFGADGGETCKENLQKLLKKCQDVHSLMVIGNVVPSETDVSFFQNTLFSNLRYILISCKAADFFCAQLFRETFPQLFSIAISFHPTPTKRHESTYMDLSYTEIFEFISRHGSTLKEIQICRGDIRVLEKQKVQVQLCDLDTEDVNTLVDQLKQIQLSELMYLATQADQVYPFCYELMKVQTQLTKLSISAGQIELWKLLPQVLKQCAQTLTEFVFYGYKPIAVADDQVFSCSLLANCSKLEICDVALDDGVQLAAIQNLPKQIKELRLVFYGLEFKLIASELEFIARELYNLEHLEIRSFISSMTLSLFKKLMNMPRLTKLIITNGRTPLHEIHSWIAQSGQGCIKIEALEDHSIFTIDRLKFNSLISLYFNS